VSQDLVIYYERELEAIRHLAREFAAQYPKTAGRLLVEPTTGRSVDPHVERLLEGFALLAGRVHHKLDDEFPELTDALLNILYPHYLAPFPSTMVVEFKADPVNTPMAEGFPIPRHSQILTNPVNPPTNDLRCKFRTAYPVTLWPVVVTGAKIQGPPYQGLRLPRGMPPANTEAVLQISLECQGGTSFEKLNLETLRFHLLGNDQNVAEIYELLLNRASQVLFVPTDKPAMDPVFVKPAEALTSVGFDREESLLPYPAHSMPGYRLLTEMFAYPAKFWFVDLNKLSLAKKAGFGRRLDLVVFLRGVKADIANLEKAVDQSTFRLGCTPAINLFDQSCQPITVSQVKSEYRVVPVHHHPQGYEIFSISEVSAVDPEHGEPVKFRPFYDITHPSGREGREAYWYPTRKASTRDGDKGTEVTLTLVDKGWDPLMPAGATLVVKAVCTNRELGAQLQRSMANVRLELERAAPLAGIECVRPPSLPLRPSRKRRGSYWRLLSHLSLNHLSISETAPAEARAALQEILRLYDFSEGDSGPRAGVNAMLIDGVVGVSSRRLVGRVGDAAASGFARGVEVTVELDEQKYVGTGAFLFASVLEQFLGLYTTVNSFTQLLAKTPGSDGQVIRRWPPRAGDKPLA